MEGHYTSICLDHNSKLLEKATRVSLNMSAQAGPARQRPTARGAPEGKRWREGEPGQGEGGSASSALPPGGARTCSADARVHPRPSLHPSTVDSSTRAIPVAPCSQVRLHSVSGRATLHKAGAAVGRGYDRK